MVNPIPSEFPRLTPYLTVSDAEAAIAFYCEVFGGKELTRFDGPEGLIGHAEIGIGDVLLFLSSEFPDFGNTSPTTLGGTPVTLSLYVEDVDATVALAVEKGAEVTRPVEDQFYGDRSGQIRDPFGHVWMLATHIEDLSEEEMQRRHDEAYG